MLKNLLLSEAIGDICGVPYEFNGTKDYNSVDLFHKKNDYSDDTVCTFACAEALIDDNKSVAECLKNRCVADPNRGYGGKFRSWLFSNKNIMPAYNSFGNGSAMRVSAAGFLATSENECIELAAETAEATHNHPEGIRGAVATALAIFYAFRGESKEFIHDNVLAKYYPDWSKLEYDEIKPSYRFNETCQDTVPASIICFLTSSDYEDCIKLAISMGGDADTMAAIAGPIAYAYYKEIPEDLINLALSKLPKWMLDLNDRFDAIVLKKMEKDLSDLLAERKKVTEEIYFLEKKISECKGIEDHKEFVEFFKSNAGKFICFKDSDYDESRLFIARVNDKVEFKKDAYDGEIFVLLEKPMSLDESIGKLHIGEDEGSEHFPIFGYDFEDGNYYDFRNISEEEVIKLMQDTFSKSFEMLGLKVDGQQKYELQKCGYRVPISC